MIGALNDGELPEEDDEPPANFFFRGEGGRLELDLGKTIPVQEVDTYSCHPDVRAPQVYKLYGSDGAAPGFVAQPKRPQDPASVGWKLLAEVDTRKDYGSEGGQYGVSVSDPAGLVGSYRYLLFDVEKTDADDGDANTFFSEIVVLDHDTPGNPSIMAKAIKIYDKKGVHLTLANNDPPSRSGW